MKPPNENKLLERTLLLFIAGVFLFCSPARVLWASEYVPWFTPYLVWLTIIFLTWLVYYLANKNDKQL